MVQDLGDGTRAVVSETGGAVARRQPVRHARGPYAVAGRVCVDLDRLRSARVGGKEVLAIDLDGRLLVPATRGTFDDLALGPLTWVDPWMP